MLKRLVLGVAFCLVVATASAAEREFSAFSVDIIEGWQLMGEPMEQEGVSMVMFMNPLKQSAVILAFAPTEGASFKDVVEMTKKNMADQGATLELVEEGNNKVVFKGKQSGVDVALTLTHDGETLGTLTVSGNEEEAAKLVRTIKTKNDKLTF